MSRQANDEENDLLWYDRVSSGQNKLLYVLYVALNFASQSKVTEKTSQARKDTNEYNQRLGTDVHS